MNPQLETFLELLELRLQLLRALAQELVACRKEFVAMDLDGMHRHISLQEELCRKIERLHPGIESLQKACAEKLGLGRSAGKILLEDPGGRLRSVLRDLHEAQSELGRLTRVHASYLRRSRRTVDVLMNFLGNYALMYAPPEQHAAQAPSDAGGR